MATQSMPVTGAARAERLRAWGRRGLEAQGRLLVLAARAVLVPVLLIWAGVCVAALTSEWSTPEQTFLAFVGLVLWLPALIGAARLSARWSRRSVADWYGVSVSAAYAVVPEPTVDERGHWWTGRSYHRGRWSAEAVLYARSVAGDAETWRDVRRLAANVVLVTVLALPCLGLLAVGVGVLLAWVAQVLGDWQTDLGSLGGLVADLPQLVARGVPATVAIGLGLALAPHAVRMYGDWLRRSFDPQAGGRQEKARLTRRVEQLTATRADAVGTQAAELRRIERDLHDGAQARLVAIGLTLGTIEHLLDTDPAAARTLLGDARQSSAKALQELRDLVRGIHPPVLAERGLADAVRELALEAPLATEVTVSLPGRPEAPVEAAVYFCVSELMVNAAKHSGAGQVWVDILYRAGELRVTVTDDGHGGAAPERGSGLRGIERRLGTFDGVLTLDSPSGGPTTITLELPCELSSPRISTFSAKA
ncbi:histidine kinase [Kitasatospora sp. NPDC094015]|uniref:sensor histidine kinase n=1 Tax=Kitasatospora sp. NPDC094015 TaxID=3155205 RepID=UPI00331F8971